jgi:hypothetical protein
MLKFSLTPDAMMLSILLCRIKQVVLGADVLPAVLSTVYVEFRLLVSPVPTGIKMLKEKISISSRSEMTRLKTH